MTGPVAMPRLRAARTPLLLFAMGLVVFGLVAGGRLWHPSSAPHFVYQADAWLHGRLAIDGPLTGDDWAKVETVELDDGSQTQGRRLSTRPAFRTLGGDELPSARVKRSLGTTAYMSFPPVPALVMLPVAAIWGRAGNDVIPTVLLAALVLPLMFLVLRRARQAGLSQRSEQEDITLALALGFGTVFFFSAVQGKVWFTAHVVGVALALGYIWAAIGAARPILAGIALGLAACTRTPMAFMFPLFALEALRVAGGLPGYRALDVAARRAMHRTLARQLLRFAAPVVVIAIGAMWLNHARFGSPTEFGHTFLDVRQQAQIEKYGLFNYHYLARNLAVAATLLPELSRAAPHVVVGGHGLALWVTTPVLLLLLWPARRGAFHRTLWITVACVAIPTLFYQNSGWVQFGYRFSLDYMPLLILLLAVGDRRFGRTTYALISLGIAINLFGAVTFDRYPQYYRTGGDAYDVVVKH